jgi:hypothetical protein
LTSAPWAIRMGALGSGLGAGPTAVGWRLGCRPGAHGLTRACADTLPSTTPCSTEDGCYSVPYYGPALVNLPELAICVAFVAIAAVMTTVLSGRKASRNYGERGDLIQASEAEQRLVRGDSAGGRWSLFKTARLRRLGC